MPLQTENLEVWPGSGSFYPLTFTPFGFYDYDSEFQCDAESVAKWCALRLGYPIMDVELQQVNFYAAFEEAVNEYGAQLNTFQARDNLINLQGLETGSINLSQKYIPQTLQGLIKLAKAYGSETGTGGNLTYFTGSIAVQEGKQVYDFVRDSTIESGSFSTDQFTIRKIFHYKTPASVRYLNGNYDGDLMLGEFGWGGYGAQSQYMLMPLYYDAMQIQQIEYSDAIRKSGYSFQLTKNRLRLFPIPSEDTTLWFHYTLDREATALDLGMYDQITGKISDISNIPYQNITYKYINQLGKQWIRKYALAISKEMLGYVRTKYTSIPYGDGELTMNGADLIAAAGSEKEALLTELKETLESMSIEVQLEKKVSIADSLNKQLAYVPLKIYMR